MSSFSVDWLSLREPADAVARPRRFTETLVEGLARNRPVRILDLAAGTGSNTRYLEGYFQCPPDWLLADHDAALLGVARSIAVRPIRTRVVDLSGGAAIHDLVAGHELVTASALLDLVSEGWLRGLLLACRDAGAAILFALNYDGGMECVPEDPEDGRVRDLLNRHQRGDKGFGPALGPDATARAASILGELGYDVGRARSDWHLQPDSAALQAELIDGWAGAAIAMAPLDAEIISAWRARRLAHVSAGRSHVLVGHEDVAGSRGLLRSHANLENARQTTNDDRGGPE